MKKNQNYENREENDIIKLIKTYGEEKDILIMKEKERLVSQPITFKQNQVN